MNAVQMPLPLSEESKSSRDQLAALLASDLDFHAQNSRYESHNFHSFPAKFPPQLPEKFILGMTNPGDVVLDPMMGSGTTIVEAARSSRHAVGLDIDPLAVRISRVKVTPVDPMLVRREGNQVLQEAENRVKHEPARLQQQLVGYWEGDSETRKFVDYWFASDTQLELLALVTEIRKISDTQVREFLEVVLSSVIITKSGGVSLALDLGHTRPHRALLVKDRSGKLILGSEQEVSIPSERQDRVDLLSKVLRSPLDDFRKRLEQNLKNAPAAFSGRINPTLRFGDAQEMPLDDASVDLIVTSPPYASNAIDYMRAHKFSLVWLDYPKYSISTLSQMRSEYIGGEATQRVQFEGLPTLVSDIVSSVAGLDPKKGMSLRRYYSEMTRVIREMYRVLRPGRAAVLVVGTSVMRGIDTETGKCIGEIGKFVGFEVPPIGIRILDRNRRMLPASAEPDRDSQIQQRMHEEYVVGLYKR